jgi:hypothetical protein
MIVNPEIVHYTPHAVVTGLLGWLLKYLASAIQTEWRDAKAKLDTIAHTTQIQAENHLHTIQENTSKTNDLLGKVVEGQAEMNGFLRGRF